jgi:hypothetical protein
MSHVYSVDATTGNITTAGTITSTGAVTLSNGNSLVFDDTELTPKTVMLAAPTTLTSSYSLKWPLSQGVANALLANDGSGNLSFTTTPTIPTGGFLQFLETSNGHSVSIQPGSVTASYTLTLPQLNGANYTTFITDGSGNLAFEHITQPITTGTARSDSADISTTTLFAANGLGNLYRVSAYIYTAAADAVTPAGTVTLTVSWTDPSNNLKSVSTLSVNLATAGDFQTLNLIIFAKSGTNVQYSTTHTGTYGTSVYDTNLSSEFVW